MAVIPSIAARLLVFSTNSVLARRRDAFWLALGVGCGVWVLVAQRDGLAAMLGLLSAVDPPLSLLALGLMAAVEVAKAWRWQALYGAQRPAFRAALQATVLGQAANALTPLHAGDLLRVLWAAPTGQGVARGAASLAITKLIDAPILAVVVAFAFGSWALGNADALVAGSVVGALVAALALGSWRGARKLGPAAKIASWVKGYLGELSQETLAVVTAATAAAWVAGAAATALALGAMGIVPTADLVVRVLASGYLAGLLPAPPGRLGVYEAAVGGALASAGLDMQVALACALLVHALQLIKVGLLAVFVTRWP